MFQSRAEWFEHEMQVHRKSWFCLFCDRESKTSEQLLQHMQKQHGETILEAQVFTILKSCERPVQGISPTACCFCGDWKVSNDAARSDADILVTPTQFRRHLGKHLEQISLFALPRRHVDDDNNNEGDQDSNRALENTSDSNSHQTEEAEEVEEVINLDQLRLLEIRGRVERIRTRKRKTLMDTISSADSRLLEQLQLLWEQALIKRTSLYGPDHPHTTELIEDLAVLYQVLERWDVLVRLRRDALKRVSKDENASVSQVTMDYDRTTAIVLLMKAYRDQDATVALDNLRMNLMRQTHISQSYPTICNTAYVLVDHGFLSEARELCTRANEMMRTSDYPPELCVLARLLGRVGMVDEAELLAYRILRILKEDKIDVIDKEFKVELSELARTFIRKEKSELGQLLRLAAMGLSTKELPFPRHESEVALPTLGTSTIVTDNSQNKPLSQHDDNERAYPATEPIHNSIVPHSQLEETGNSESTELGKGTDLMGTYVPDEEVLGYVNDIVQKILNRPDPIPIDADLFSYGIDSLQYVETMQGIFKNEVMPLKLEVATQVLLDNRTIEG